MGKNVLIKIEYDGTDFCGWQIQPDVRTVQGEIEHVLRYIAGEEVHIHGTSRTDAGVHALGQCASFEWNSNMPVEKLPEVMNRRFGAGGEGRNGAPGDIRILSAEVMPDGFHARYSCKGKTYRYHDIINAYGLTESQFRQVDGVELKYVLESNFIKMLKTCIVYIISTYKSTVCHNG